MPGPLSVLYCIDRLPANGGTEKQLIGLIERLDRSRCDVHLCTLGRHDEQPRLADCRELPLTVNSLGRPQALREIRRLAAYLREHRIGVVHGFFQDGAVVAAAAGRLAGVPVRLRALRDLGFWRTALNQWPTRAGNLMCTGWVANSEAVKRHFCAADRLDPERVEVVYNGLDTGDYPFHEHLDGSCHIGLVSNLDRPVKRIDLFLEAAALLAPQRPDLTWHVVGTGQRLDEFRDLAARLGLGQRVVFTGFVPDVRSYLARLAIGVICSDSEGLSNSLLEYMLCGCAAVATDVGGNSETIDHGETGLLVAPGDARALAGAMEKLAVDGDMRRRLAARARQEAAARFDWSRCVDAHHELYESRLASATRP